MLQTIALLCYTALHCIALHCSIALSAPPVQVSVSDSRFVTLCRLALSRPLLSEPQLFACCHKNSLHWIELHWIAVNWIQMHCIAWALVSSIALQCVMSSGQICNSSFLHWKTIITSSSFIYNAPLSILLRGFTSRPLYYAVSEYLVVFGLDCIGLEFGQLKLFCCAQISVKLCSILPPMRWRSSSSK